MHTYTLTPYSYSLDPPAHAHTLFLDKHKSSCVGARLYACIQTRKSHVACLYVILYSYFVLSRAHTAVCRVDASDH